MKKIRILLLFLLLTICLSVPAFAFSGEGTEENPYLISSAADFAKMHEDLGGYYKLTCNINMAGVDYEPVGNESEGAFTGTLDGDGFTVSNLDLDLAGNKYVGVIGYLEGTVKNLTVKNVNANGYNYVGGIAGYAESGSLIDNCAVSGITKAQYKIKEVFCYVGGIVGNNYGAIENCHNDGAVFTIAYDARCYVGGIAGSNYGNVKMCTNDGIIGNGISANTGGIVGNNSGKLMNCFNSGKVDCGFGYSGLYGGYDTYAGGISACGYGEILNCFNGSIVKGGDRIGGIAYEGNLKNCISSALISGKYTGSESKPNTFSLFAAKSYEMVCTKERFCSTNYFSGFDFENVWYIDPDTNSGFPQLRGLPEHLKLNECLLILSAGETKKLNASWNGASQTVTWSCDDETIATVASDGTVTAKSVGICTITATDANGEKANCSVRVYERASSAVLSQTELTLAAGNIAKFTCTKSPSTSNETVYWTSDDEEVVTMYDDGSIRGKKVGTATITATLLESGRSYSCAVTVIGNPVTKLTLSSTSLSMAVGDTRTLTPTVTPTEYAGVLTWLSTEESVATVSSTGEITAKYPGSTVISVESESGIRATCTVTVTAPVTEMHFEEEKITLERGLSKKLNLTVLPSYTTNSISYSSSNTSYVTVDSGGVITAKSVGIVTITATASNGMKAYCTVTVVPTNIPVTSVTLDRREVILTRGDKLQLNASVLPENGTNRTLTWTSSNEAAVSVSNTGVIVAEGEGSAVIRAESVNGMFDECIVSVISASGPAVVLSATKGSPQLSAEITASIVKNPGISAYRFTVDYDASVLTPTAIIPNEDFGGTFESNLADDTRDNLTVLWYDTEDQTADGELFTVTFTVAENAAVGTSTPVSLSWAAADICNQTGAHVALYQKNTAVEIAETLWGDVSGDGELTVYDLTLLARYVTGLETFSARQLEIADICADGEVDIRDVVKLAQTLLGIEEPPQLLQALRLFSAPANEPQVSVGTASCTQDGEVRIPVYLSGNTGISGFRYAVSYNADELEILSVEPAMESLAAHFSTNCGIHEDGQVIVSWYDTADMEEDGELFVITAKLKNGNTDISELHIEAAENNMCDAKLACVSADYRKGYALTSAGLVANKSVDSGIFTCDVYCDETVAGSNRMAILALYGSNGQYLGCTSERVTLVSGKNELRFSVSVATYSRYKLMLLDGTSYVPLLSGA